LLLLLLWQRLPHLSLHVCLLHLPWYVPLLLIESIATQAVPAMWPLELSLV
jgi:hypothetical protein